MINVCLKTKIVINLIEQAVIVKKHNGLFNTCFHENPIIKKDFLTFCFSINIQETQ